MKIKVDKGTKLASSITLTVGRNKAIVSARELTEFRKVAERLGIEFEDVS